MIDFFGRCRFMKGYTNEGGVERANKFLILGMGSALRLAGDIHVDPTKREGG
jgi:hypothetical protein